jgi:hypothetical protein
MPYRESDIVHECGDHWVLQRKPGWFEVLRAGITHSVVVATYDFKGAPALHEQARQRAVADCDRRAAKSNLAPEAARHWFK